MTMAGSLTDAAQLTFDQMRIKSNLAGNSIKTALGLFIADVDPLFPDDIPNNRPVGNWLIPMKANQNEMRGLDMTLVSFNAAVDHVAKMCWAATTAELTGAQGAAMLAAWNTRFGTV